MRGYVCNPYLPLYEYVPDGEPRVFGDRLYVYGSHDLAGGDFFCLGDYVVWSAPLTDLSDWKYEGVSYRRDQDPHNSDGKWELFAPDVVRGADGRYYLYYCLRMQREFGVAVSDSPAGPFAFYAHIRRKDGSLLAEDMPYDPSVLVDDDGRVYLYYGYTSDSIAAKFGAPSSPGGMVVELEPDMKTLKTEPVICLPRDTGSAGTGFEGHAYYEGPSMRKINGRYYFVYSSEQCHELCYAVSDRPTEGFSYGGVIVSNADIGLKGRQNPEKPVCMPGNNHGGLVCVQGQYYIFYQRHTQCTQYSRQGCAEPVTILADGSIPQVEITSSGMNGAALPAKGIWSAAYACSLTNPDTAGMLAYRDADPQKFPAIWEDIAANDQMPEASHPGDYIAGKPVSGNGLRREQYIRNITDGVVFGFKYFKAVQVKQISLTLRGHACGTFEIRLDDPMKGALLAVMPVNVDSEDWQSVKVPVDWDGVNALYLTYSGSGSVDVRELCF